MFQSVQVGRTMTSPPNDTAMSAHVDDHQTAARDTPTPQKLRAELIVDSDSHTPDGSGSKTATTASLGTTANAVGVAKSDALVGVADDAASRAAPSVKTKSTRKANELIDPPPHNGQKQKRDSTPAPPIAEEASASIKIIKSQDDDLSRQDILIHSYPSHTSATMGAAAKDDKTPSASPEASSKPVVDDDVTKAPVADGDDKAAAAETEEAAAEKTDAAPAEEAAEEKTDKAPEAEDATPSKPAKTPVSIARRKSVGPKLNRKGSKARITHLDAKPGDHYFVKLKGYPAWPVVICDEDMLPQTLLKGRPVTAARPDGTYREDYADGGKRAADRTFPVMYLSTNEFGWVPNQDLHDLDPSKVIDSINDKMRKDLQEAHRIAAENNPLDYFKDLLRQFQEELELEEERQREAAAKRLATPKKVAPKKSKGEDVDMMDVPEDDDEPVSQKKSVSKKRKADDDTRTPQRSDSVKKPKIKITSSSTPKSNGTPSSTKAKTDGKTKAKTDSKAKEPVEVPADPEPTPEEKLRRKAKEVLFLRHKIQKGLLPRDEEPKADEMEGVSDFLTKLEGFPDLEVSVIRETKINKVLKAVLKIVTIPREEDFKFKSRSQALLDKWNKLLAAEPVPATAATNGTAKEGANGTKDEPKKKDAETKDAEAKETKEAKSNGIKEDAKPAEKKADEPAAVEAEA